MTLKQQLNSENYEKWDEKLNHLCVFGSAILFSCPVWPSSWIVVLVSFKKYFLFVYLSCWVAMGLAGAYVLCLFWPLLCFLIVKCFECLKALCKFPIIIIMFHEYACTDQYHIAWVFSWDRCADQYIIYINVTSWHQVMCKLIQHCISNPDNIAYIMYK